MRLTSLFCVVFLDALNFVSPISRSCKDFIQSNDNFGRQAEEMTSGEELKSSIKSSQSMFLLLNLINGTRWLNLGGSLDNFELVLGVPPDTSSDLGLDAALELLTEKWSPRGVVLKFNPPELSTDLTRISTKNGQDLPLWISYTLDALRQDCSLCSTYNVNIFWNKKFGLDSIFNRVSSENILLPSNYQRIRRIVDNLYQGQRQDSDQRFLKSLYDQLNEKHPKAFTMLFLESAIQLVENSKEHPEDLMFLPDLQDKGEPYTNDEVEDVGKLLAAKKLNNQCVLLTVRAGNLVKGDSLKAFQSLLSKNPNVMLNVFSEPFDLVPTNSLQEVTSTLGKDAVIFQLPSKERDMLMKEVPSSSNNVPKPNLDVQSDASFVGPQVLFIFVVVGVFTYFM